MILRFSKSTAFLYSYGDLSSIGLDSFASNNAPQYLCEGQLDIRIGMKNNLKKMENVMKVSLTKMVLSVVLVLTGAHAFAAENDGGGELGSANGNSQVVNVRPVIRENGSAIYGLYEIGEGTPNIVPIVSQSSIVCVERISEVQKSFVTSECLVQFQFQEEAFFGNSLKRKVATKRTRLACPESGTNEVSLVCGYDKIDQAFEATCGRFRAEIASLPTCK
jgi:hypothetical protein